MQADFHAWLVHYNTDSWGDKTTVKVAYQANYQFINSSDLGDIGWILNLTPAGSQPTKIATYVPWAGDNSLWVGQSDADPDNLRTDIVSNPDGLLSKSATFGSFKYTISINKLRGETDGAYFYGVLIVIEPA